MIKKQDDDDDCNIIDEIYLYVKDPNESKHRYLVTKHEKNGLGHQKCSKTFIKYIKIQCINSL